MYLFAHVKYIGRSDLQSKMASLFELEDLLTGCICWGCLQARLQVLAGQRPQKQSDMLLQHFKYS